MNDLKKLLEAEVTEPFQEEESFRGMLVNLGEFHDKTSAARTSISCNIEEQLVPILTELLEQVKRKLTDPTNTWTALDVELHSDLEKYSRLKHNVRNALVKYQDDQQNQPRDNSRDPYLANVGILC